MKRIGRTFYAIALVSLAVSVAIVVGVGAGAGGSVSHVGTAAAASTNSSDNTTTPIKHVVVIFDENQSFDHYFGTYPYASNTDGTNFCPAAGTPGLPGASESVNSELAAGLLPSSTLGSPVTAGDCATYSGVTPNPEAGANPPVANPSAPNPNEYQPQRIPQTADETCDNNHGYTAEEEAEDNGKMDDFVQYTSNDCTIPGVTNSSPGIGLDYYDGNSVTALWNWAQNYGMSDNSWDAGFGPSFPGYVNSFGGTTYSTIMGKSMTSNVDPEWDVDSQGWESSGENIADLLNAKGVTWGSFLGSYGNPGATGSNLGGDHQETYVPGFDPFDYWQDTSNADHTAPASLSEIGFGGAANHNYDLDYFFDALDGTGGATLPAVSFLRPVSPQSGHPGNSGPLDEQESLTQEVNAVEQSPYWPSTAIVVEYDDSDGWYDHQSPTDDIYTASGAVASNPSTNNIIYDSSNGSGDAAVCANAYAAGVPEIGGEVYRCGPSQRLPFVVISPYAKKDYVDHALVTQDSTLKFIEQNWGLPTLGTDTFDNLAQVSNLDSFFDWSSPQQNEVILDPECNVPGLTVVSNTCNNTTANAEAGDGVEDEGTTTDAGFGAVQSTPALSTQIPNAPNVSVQNSAVSVPLSVTGTLSAATLEQATGASTTDGTLTADVSGVDLATAGAYTASVSATDDFTYEGDPESVDSLDPQTVTVDVVPTINVPSQTLTYETSSPPSAAQILSDSGASIDSGTLDEPSLSGIDLSTPGTYQVQVTGSARGQEAAPVEVTVDMIPDPTIAVTNATVYYQAGEVPSPAQVIADAGATINAGNLEQPDLSSVDFTTAGSYTINLEGSSGSFTAASVPLTIQVVDRPAVTLTSPVVAYVTGSDPSASKVLSDSGAETSAGDTSVDLSTVDFDQAGTYTASVTGSDHGVSAQPMALTVDVLAQPTVTLGTDLIETTVGSALDANQVLTDIDATVSGGGVVSPVNLSAVNFSQAGDYPVTVTGSVDGLTATSATATIRVVAVPAVSVTDSRLTYPVGASVDAADVLSAAGASVSGSGDASVDLSSVDFNTAGTYSVQITGGADGVAATPATVSITVQPVVGLQSDAVSFTAGSHITASSVLDAAGASTSAGSVNSPSLAGVVPSEAGTYDVTVNGSAKGITAKPATLKIVIKPRLSVARRRIKVARFTHLTAKLLVRQAGAKLRDGGKEVLGAKLGSVKTRVPGSYDARITAGEKGGTPAASVKVKVVVGRR